MDNYEELVDPSTFIPRFTNDRPETKWIICGAAIYIAALSHDIADMGEETITYILNEFANTEAAEFNCELRSSKKATVYCLKNTFTPRPNSDKEVVNCKHKDSKSFGYGLCKDCHEKFIEVSTAVCLSEESEASDESDNLSDLDGDPVESKNAPPASTAFEACTRMLESKGLVNYDL
ncbi:hypothetical protein F2Q70_00024242 [Brassica cretica]|uniref:Uncharacterized protein n=1 Tax=Brassica cretica TaxID=69181 RepID=A0A8S9L901_BRACR|nr:hypothetical protein F2Q70_00024242 [Brassica cretica]